MSLRSAPQRPEGMARATRDEPGKVARLFGVLVTYRRPAELAETLRRISMQDRELEALIVVDNAPHPKVEAVVQGFADSGCTVHYLRSERPKVKAKRRTIGRRFWLADPEWHSYYSLRNLIYIVRSAGWPVLALRITLARGLLKPIVNGFLTPRQGWKQLRLNRRACRDAWSRRMGRTLEPGQV